MRPGALRRQLSQNIRRAADRRGITLNAVADFAGISRSHLYAVLKAERSVTLDRIEKIASALEVEPWELLRPAK